VALREFLNEKRKYVTGLTIAIIAFFLVLIVIELVTSRRSIPSENKAFFTVDDGNTWFVDDANNVPPYDYNGKQAVRAIVFSYSGGQFVGYLEEYPPKIHDELAAATTDAEREQYNPEYEVLCKPPNRGVWVKERSVRGHRVTDNPIPPNGDKNEIVVQVEP
jgi:hypothetical protein